MDKSLKLFNSFTRKKDPFVPNEKKTIKWYSCGPTVYDVAHLGHARCYITFDIIRRILTGYFGYQVLYIMNITDIDDKIIKRARSNHLCDKFIEQFIQSKQPELVDQIRQALGNYKTRRADEKDPAKIDMFKNIIAESEKAIENLVCLIKENNQQQTIHETLEKLRDVIADEQDIQLGHTVSDHQIFKTLTMKFEQEYHEDMKRLDVLPPCALTRVSEYIDEIGNYIKRLEANGFAYRSGGSIYFDTNKFNSDPKHTYAKLVREAYGQNKDLDEGEGELSQSHQSEKKSPVDFALWKKSKVGEPSWQTQDFEAGRPGWHIECSVMASHLLGENFDIHSGGCDLKFPHHDNEIAQAEAYYNTGKNWVNYFIHSGHLTISGCKMSKSLKNFITIRQALQEYTSRQLRFAFLAHGWTETLDYSTNTMNTALCYEKTFREFFLNVSDVFRRQIQRTNNAASSYIACELFKKWTSDDHQLNCEFLTTINSVDSSLCDNFDTRSTLNALTNLVKECNKRSSVDLILLKDIASYIKKLLDVFGASFDEINFDRFFNNTTQDGQLASSSVQADNTEMIMKYIDVLGQFRAEIRRISKSGDAQQSVKQILSLCDDIRDQTLPNLGVRLEDKEVDGASYVVKLVDPETLARERALNEKRELDKKLKEETKKMEMLKLQQQREEKAKVPPSEMFKSQLDKYSKFDEKGMPTHDSTGKEISKSALKKLQRLYAEQEARYTKYLSESK